MDDTTSSKAASRPSLGPSLGPSLEPSLDLRGLKCPLPVLKARRAIKAMASGSRIEIFADDPAAGLDFAHFCETTGHRLLTSESRDDGVLHFIIGVTTPEGKG